MDTMNKVFARGRIISVGRSNMGHPEMTLLIREKRERFVHFALLTALAQDIRIGDYVNVTGHVKAYGYRNEMQNKWSNVQYFVADTVEKDNTEMEEVFGVEGHFHHASYFRAYFRGEVSSAFDTSNENWGKLTVRTDGVGDDKRPSYTTFSYLKGWRLPVFQYEKKDIVCLIAIVNTPQKVIDGKTVNFENLIIEDIVKVDSDNHLIPMPTAPRFGSANRESDRFGIDE